MSDGGADSLTQSLTESFTHSLSKENAGAGAECCQFSFQTLVQLVRMAPRVLYSGCKGQRAVPEVQAIFDSISLVSSYCGYRMGLRRMRKNTVKREKGAGQGGSP